MSRFRNRPIRNPRYAPEFLERKLSPSTVDIGMPPADVYYTDPIGSDPATTDAAIPYDTTTTDPTAPTDPTDPGDPTPDDPTPPPDPSGPAIT